MTTDEFLGFRDLWCRVSGLGFSGQCLVFRVQVLRCGVRGLTSDEFVGVQGLVFGVQCLVFTVQLGVDSSVRLWGPRGDQRRISWRLRCLSWS